MAMKTRQQGTRGLFGLIAFGLILSISASPAAAFEGPGRYYSETGHTLDARFVFFYDAHGGLELIGFPITEAFLDPYTGLLVQYFQNARFELAADPDTGGLAVRMSPLGDLMGGWEASDQAGSAFAGSRSGCEFYPPSGHSVCHAFLDFFLIHGGVQQLGYPISEIVLENERLVQYFQGFRLEWAPESGMNSQIRVAPLGRLHFEYMGYNRNFLRPNPPSNTFTYEILTLQLGASLMRPVVGADDEQTVFIHVLDQNFQPVQNAAVTLVIHFSDEDRIILLTPTDSTGISRAAIRFEGKHPGEMVVLEYVVSYGTVAARTTDSFRIWW